MTSSEEGSAGNSEYLLCEAPIDKKRIAAEGIATLFRLFPYERHTFQFIKTDADGKTSSPVHVFTDAKKALDHSYKLNRGGYDVYFMVNEGDGVIHSGKRIPRSQSSVSVLSKCFIDTDNCPIERVTTYLQTISLTPHLTVESSPGRFHLYFFLEDMDKSESNVQRWQAVQHILHRLGDPAAKPSKLGTDGTMHDYSKVLRVPGFTHVKKLHSVKVVSSSDHAPYTLDEIFQLTSAQSWIDHQTDWGNASNSSVPTLEGPPFEKGERYENLQKLAMSLANQDIDTKQKVATFAAFARTRIDNSDGVYVGENGALTQKSLSLLTSALDKVKRERRQQVEVLHTTLQATHDNTPAPSPWELPDSFYLSAPNGFGDVVRQVMEYSLYPCASLAFGTFLTGLSILKAKTHFTPYGASPALYTLNVAISGFGKNDPMTLLQNLFVSLGYGKLIENEIRSDRTIYNLLGDNSGTGLCILDEIAPLLKVIQDEKATSHHANISKALLFLYSSAAMKGVSFGRVASSNTKKGEKAIVVDNPMLAVLGFTVPQEFNRLFNSASIVKGLFQRFIPIVTKLELVPKSPTADKSALVKSALFNHSVTGTAQEVDDNGDPVAPLQTVPMVKMPFTKEAKAHFEEIDRSYREKMYNAAKNEETASLSGVYSRIAEQIERVATVLAQDEIDLTTLEYAAAFMDSRHRAVMATIQDTVMAQDDRKVSMERETIVLNVVSKLCQEKSTSNCTKSEIFKRVRRKMSLKDLDIVIHEAELAGKIVTKTGDKGQGTKIQIGNVLLENV